MNLNMNFRLRQCWLLFINNLIGILIKINNYHQKSVRTENRTEIKTMI